LKRSISNSKKDIEFLLTWYKNSYSETFLALVPCTCVITTWIDSSLPDVFTTSQSPSHSDLCHFKVTILAPV
jgi:hypothetical protein